MRAFFFGTDRSVTFAERIREAGGYTSGFDYLRLMLAVLVLYGHSIDITDDHSFLLPHRLAGIKSYIILPMFFSLSGFLVSASLLRTRTIGMFLLLRGLRIYPALVVEIALSALVLGPLLSSSNLATYFTSKDFFLYFLNALGYIHYHLPGVFNSNFIPRTVNGSLWTVPYELECYITLVILSLIGMLKHPRFFLISLLLVTIGMFAYYTIHGDPHPERTTASGRQLVLFFVAGVLLYLLRDRVIYSARLAIVAAAASAVLITSHVLIYLAPIPVAYITAFLGLCTPKKIPIIFKGDYSYGVYLYAFPIQQAVYLIAPALRFWYLNFPISLGITGLFAMFSWHFIEKPMLGLKRLVITRSNRRPDAEQMISPDKTNDAVAVADDGAQIDQATAR